MIDFIKIIATYAEEHKVAEMLKGKNVRQETTPADKEGQLFKITYVNDIEVSREYIPDPEYVSPEPDGDFLRPYPYVNGMEVVSGKFYFLYDPDLPHEAIKDGIPASFDDTEYFDIVG